MNLISYLEQQDISAAHLFRKRFLLDTDTPPSRNVRRVLYLVESSHRFLTVFLILIPCKLAILFL